VCVCECMGVYPTVYPTRVYHCGVSHTRVCVSVWKCIPQCIPHECITVGYPTRVCVCECMGVYPTVYPTRVYHCGISHTCVCVRVYGSVSHSVSHTSVGVCVCVCVCECIPLGVYPTVYPTCVCVCVCVFVCVCVSVSHTLQPLSQSSHLFIRRKLIQNIMALFKTQYFTVHLEYTNHFRLSAK